ncbi:HlyD family secretion protein [Stenotrophomonas sp. LM091]|uniref:HlyD family secretion protein n=1 Tax=Stenotrophomonas sp. LM091 TaxID=1904944 RepID=UPI0009F6B877|nr:HlyD family secretion protein [Stenotrophomonas sp. LM091]
MNAPVSPEQRFRRWVYSSLTVGLLLFLYFIIADLHMPVSPEARLGRRVVQVAPEVSGRVVSIHVQNNQRVARGDVLFTIDPTDYAQAVADAKLQLEASERDNRAIDASIAGAKAQLLAARTQAVESSRQAARYKALAGSQYVSQQSADELAAASAVAAAQVQIAERELQRLAVERGALSGDNLSARQALVRLETAHTSLGRTSIRAASEGIVSNMQLEQGAYAAAGVARLALVTPAPTLYGDFREKSLRNVVNGDRAAVVFDARPGEVFRAEVIGIDAGVRNGQQAADGQLAVTEQTDRWVRQAERARVNLRLLDAPDASLITGARATIQLYPHDSGVLDVIADAQIRLISWFHYVY